jgi:hypothetical protein
LREVEAPTFSDIRLTDGGKVVSPKLGPLFTPRKIPGTHFCWRLTQPQGHSATGRIMQIEKKKKRGEILYYGIRKYANKEQ